MRNYIVVHHSYSNWGSASVIDEWHRERGFDRIGYHFVIGNGYPTYDHWKNKKRVDMFDGMVEIGRSLDSDSVLESGERGAGVRGWNSQTLHICLIGISKFSIKQFGALTDTVDLLREQFSIGIADVKGHYEFDDNKACPDFGMQRYRDILTIREGLVNQSFSL